VAVAPQLPLKIKPTADNLPTRPGQRAFHPPNGPPWSWTLHGRIACQFYQRQAPKAVANFIAWPREAGDWTDPATRKVQHNKRYYDGTLPSLIPSSDPGGDPTGTGWAIPASFHDEFDPDLNFDRPGRLAMATPAPTPAASSSSRAGRRIAHQHYTLFGQCDERACWCQGHARVQRNRTTTAHARGS